MTAACWRFAGRLVTPAPSSFFTLVPSLGVARQLFSPLYRWTAPLWFAGFSFYILTFLTAAFMVFSRHCAWLGSFYLRTGSFQLFPRRLV